MERFIVSVFVFLTVHLQLAHGQDTPSLAPQPTLPAVMLDEQAAAIAAMQAELDELRSRLETEEARGNSTAILGRTSQIRTGAGYYGGFELVVVKPHYQSEVDFLYAPGPGGGGGGGGDAGVPDTGGADAAVPDTGYAGPDQQLNPDFGYHATPRFYLGVRNETGLGARVRYWKFDEDAKPLPDSLNGPFVETHALNLDAIDMEATLLRWWSFTDIELSGGLRYAKLDTDAAGQPNSPFVTGGFFGSSFQGAGPTAALSATRYLGASSWALVGNVRGSLLFGNTDYATGSVNNSGTRQVTFLGEGKSDFLPVVESQVGLQYSRPMGRFVFTANTLLEAQWWSGVPNGADQYLIAMPPSGLDRDDDLGFFGGTASFGLRY